MHRASTAYARWWVHLTQASIWGYTSNAAALWATREGERCCGNEALIELAGRTVVAPFGLSDPRCGEVPGHHRQSCGWERAATVASDRNSDPTARGVEVGVDACDSPMVGSEATQLLRPLPEARPPRSIEGALGRT
jgi:hypothetical protein